MFFILIKDIVNNREYIYNKNAVDKHDLSELFQYYFKQLDNNELLFQEHETYAEIYKNTDIVNKGWVWNSVDQQKQVIYLLTAIELYDNCYIPTPILTTTTTQTSIFDIDTVEEYKYIDSASYHELDSDSESDSSLNANTNMEFRHNECQKIYDIWNTECIYTNNTIYDNNNNDENIQFVVGNGYANTLLFPWQELSIELKQKLNTPNFGLRQTNNKL
jgi:hypothetical protein